MRQLLLMNYKGYLLFPQKKKKKKKKKKSFNESSFNVIKNCFSKHSDPLKHLSMYLIYLKKVFSEAI